MQVRELVIEKEKICWGEDIQKLANDLANCGSLTKIVIAEQRCGDLSPLFGTVAELSTKGKLTEAVLHQVVPPIPPNLHGPSRFRSHYLAAFVHASTKLPFCFWWRPCSRTRL